MLNSNFKRKKCRTQNLKGQNVKCFSCRATLQSHFISFEIFSSITKGKNVKLREAIKKKGHIFGLRPKYSLALPSHTYLGLNQLGRF